MATVDLIFPLTGGLLVGLSATVLLLMLGRVAGVSGVVASLTQPVKLLANWRLGFVIGLVASGLVLLPHTASATPGVPMRLQLVGAGFLVGVGTIVGNGCTSGHGVCGLSRFSLRSLVATIVFMFAAICVVAIVRHCGSGVSS